MISLLLCIRLATAGGFYLEAPPVDARAEAAELQSLAEELGLEARVMRRYRHGSGWEFVVVAEGFEQRAEAERAAQRLAELSGQGIAVYRLEGGDAEPSTESLNPVDAATYGIPEAADLLKRAARAVGGTQGGQARLDDANAIRFRYTRTIMTPEATVAARHEWVSVGDSRRVEIEVLEDSPGISSWVLSGPSENWVVVDDEWRQALPAQSLGISMELSPMTRLAWPLQFAVRSLEAGPYRVARQELVSGKSCWVLVAMTLLPDQPSRIWLEADSGRPARVDFATEAGRVELTLLDWREPDTGVVVPFLMELRRDGALVERIEVHELTLEPALNGDLFFKPEGG
jgi:hypothetical protein